MNLSNNQEPSNKLLENEDPYEQLRISQAELAKLYPEMLEDEKLCYEVFHMNDFGKKLMERWEKLFLMTTKVDPYSQNAMQASFYWETIRAFIIGVKTQASNHRMRVESP